MEFLKSIQTGRAPMPPRILVYGTEGTGKSTVAACTPKPIFIQTEDGLGEIDCAKFPLARSFGDVMTALEELASQPHDFETIVVDSLDWLERLIWQDVCTAENVSNIEKIGFQ